MTDAARIGPKGKKALQMVTGAVFGAGSVILFMETIGKPRLAADDPGVIVALVAGLVYGMISLFVGLGALAPRQGALFLNVEDEEEIREERSSLLPSAASGLLFALFLLVLAMAPEAGPGADRTWWLAVAASSLAGSLAIAVACRNKGDELLRQVAHEAGAMTLNITFVIACVWGMLAQLGYAAWLSPLALIGGLSLLYLLVIFRVVGKKGLAADR
jgi:hypothetical protein